MSRRQSPAEQARTALLDATTVAAIGDQARQSMMQNAGGYSATTPGASPAEAQGSTECPNPDCNNTRPCTTHDPDATQQLTPTERLASQRDKALNDLTVYDEAGRKAAAALATQARIATFWGRGGVTGTDVKAKLNATLREVWCEHCSRFDRHQPKAKDRTECDQCIDFRTMYKRPPTAEQYAAFDARGGKRWDTPTVHRIFKRSDAERKAKQAADRQTQRLAQREAKQAS